MTDFALQTEAELLALIAAGEKESISLDYKACDALGKTDGKKNEISKDIAAFANSAGGTVIYGILEDGHVPTRLDTGFSPEDISKEWLEQVINSRIQRRIDGIRIHQIELTSTSPGRVSYVVVVPQSSRAPHQSADKRFYKRFNFESVPMEEYEVRDVARRAHAPDLAASIECTNIISSGEPDSPIASHTIDLVINIWNKSVEPAMYAVFNIYFDKRLKLDSGTVSGTYPGGSRQLTMDGITAVCNEFQLNHAPPIKMPIFSGMKFKLFDSAPRFRLEDDGVYFVGIEMSAPGMTNRLVAAALIKFAGDIQLVESAPSATSAA